MATKPRVDTMKLTDARQNFSALVNEVYHGERRVIVEKSGIPVAAIISVADLERLADGERRREENWQRLGEMRAALEPASDEELMREALKAIAEVRAATQAERKTISDRETPSELATR